MLRRSPKHGPIALDIGASSIKMLQLRDEGREPCIQAAFVHHLPSDLSDPIERLEAAKAAIAEAMKYESFLGREVVSALGINDFQIKNIRLPRMPAAELDAAIEFEAQDRFDFGDTPVQYRHIPVGQVRHGNELKEEVVVCAAPEQAVEDRIELLESLKLVPVGIDITPCAVARGFIRFMRRAEDADVVNVFLDIGWAGSSVIVTRGADVSFLKTADVGGKQFNAAVAKALGFTTEEAGDLRIRIMRESRGRRSDDKTGVTSDLKAAVGDAIRPLAERLNREIQLCLRYYAVTFRGQRPESLTFVGGEAHEPTLMQVVSSAIDVPCMVGHPLRGAGHVEVLGGPAQACYLPGWATACGLALRGTRWVQVLGNRTAARAGSSLTGSGAGVGGGT